MLHILFFITLSRILFSYFFFYFFLWCDSPTGGDGAICHDKIYTRPAVMAGTEKMNAFRPQAKTGDGSPRNHGGAEALRTKKKAAPAALKRRSRRLHKLRPSFLGATDFRKGYHQT
jgi:hypothetical protein